MGSSRDLNHTIEGSVFTEMYVYGYFLILSHLKAVDIWKHFCKHFLYLLNKLQSKSNSFHKDYLGVG